jgi:hypothetical protein
MRRLASLGSLGLLSVAAVIAAAPAAEAQQQYRYRQDGQVLILNVKPRSYLDPGNVVPVGSEHRAGTAFSESVSYLNMPPWHHQRDRFGAGTLPDPVTNGPFVGARNPFGPIDWVAPR